jgi:F420-non-reducing hydrogenase large subunit
MSRRIKIDPITRLEGHGNIEIIVSDDGQVEKVYFQVPDFKGFEKFCEGRAVEELPILTQKICGVCPTAHHTASSKALDELFGVEPPSSAKKIRELIYNAFIFEDHLLHFYFLGGPDLIMGADAPIPRRNIFGVLEKLAGGMGKKMIEMRRRVRGINAIMTGSPLYPVNGLPGGVSKPVTKQERAEIEAVARDAVEFAKSTLKIFHDVVLKSDRYRKWLESGDFSIRTYYMGLVDNQNRVNFYEGNLRVVDPLGKEFAKFPGTEYLRHLEERVEPWSYQKVLYLKQIGWRGFRDGEESGVYRVGPLARMNVSDGMATPLAHGEYQRMVDALGGKPVHNTMAYHWARLIEVLYAAERMGELVKDDEITSLKIRVLPEQSPDEGVGVCEAPRGTLLHHYVSNENGIAAFVNLLVATQHSAAAICMSVEKAARALLQKGSATDATRNMVEMAYRAYDPCLACATH